MLVLGRFRGERIRIGNGWLVVVDVDRRTGKVRLGLDFPKDVAIVREEVYRRQNDAGKDERC